MDDFPKNISNKSMVELMSVSDENEANYSPEELILTSNKRRSANNDRTKKITPNTEKSKAVLSPDELNIATGKRRNQIVSEPVVSDTNKQNINKSGIDLNDDKELKGAAHFLHTIKRIIDNVFNVNSSKWIKQYWVITVAAFFIIIIFGFIAGIGDATDNFFDYDITGSYNDFLDFLIWFIGGILIGYIQLVANMLIIQFLNNVQTIREKTENK